MKMKTITIRIYRTDSSSKNPGRFMAYTVKVSENEQLLDVLEKIKTGLDKTLSYRKSCRHGICGSCAVKVNNKPVLACKTPLWDLCREMGPELFIEPLDKKRALKDLITDMGDFWEKIETVDPFLVDVKEREQDIGAVREEEASNPDLSSSLDADDPFGMRDADYCIQCGSCYYVCPVTAASSSFLGPSAFTKAYRFLSDARDYSATRLASLHLPYKGVWDCAKCLLCVEACPKSINPFEKITLLHEMGVFRKEYVRDARVRHARVFKAQVFLTGYINEFFLALFTLRFRMAVIAFRGFRLFLKRKLHINPFTPRSIKRYEIRKLLLNKGRRP